MIAYVFKVIAGSGIFFLFYLLLLEKEKMLVFNRFYLLISLLFAFIIPFFEIPVEAEVADAIPSFLITPDLGAGTASFQQSEALPKEDNSNLPLYIYSFISSLLLLRYVKNVVKLYLKSRNKIKVPYHGALLVLSEEKGSPFSFLRFIFVPGCEYQNQEVPEDILLHEVAHVKQKHTLDILLVELLFVFAWMNPFVWLYKKAVQLNHEYLADAQVLQQTHDVKDYQLLLLHKYSKANQQSLSSSFNYLFTKKRLVMMHKNTSFVAAALKQVAILPLLVLVVFVFSSRVEAQQKEKTEEKTAEKRKSVSPTEKKDTTRRPPVFVGRETAFTTEGASDEEMEEYQTICKKYVKPYPFWWNKNPVTAEDEKRLEAIFVKMDREQQRQQHIAFIGPTPAAKKIEPTKAQYSAWKDANIYGVWLNDKKINNSVLDNYSNTDISHFFVSKLYPNARKNVKYFYQVNLMTDSYFEKTNNERLANKRNHMVYRGWQE